jgi:formylglycine-generating enzyme required for sulfatase activity
MLTQDLFKQISELLRTAMGDADDRKALIESALLDSRVLEQIQWNGAARTFTTRLVRLLDQFGEISPGRPALVALIEEYRQEVGTNVQAEIDTVLSQLAAAAKTPPALKPAVPSLVRPLEKAFVEDDLYVFISYARPDQAIASQVEGFLTAAGVRVFRDTSDINAGDNWDLKIEQALRDCQCMVILLSAASMPERKEVHREWFNFDQKGKKIYPLYIQDCTLHSRFDSRNYIDARSDLEAALDRLLAALRKDFKTPVESKKKIKTIEGPATPAEALEALNALILGNDAEPTVPPELASLIRVHRPTNVKEFRLCRIVEWSSPRYHLDKQFVNLTILLDQGETAQQRWQRAEDFRFNDLRDVLKKTENDPVLALLGAPGSGKSTLLRRLQLDHSVDRLRNGGDQINFFVQLNGYRPKANGQTPDPCEWLEEKWSALYPQLPPLQSYLSQGRTLLLLDALNEMQHKSTADYHRLVDHWRSFAQEASRQGNRVLFSCRSLDYSASLSSPDLRVPQIEVQPMNTEQMREFLRAYAPQNEERIWKDLEGSPQFDLFKTPYFLKLLCEQVEAIGEMPKGRAALFTGFVRQVLGREINGKLFQLDVGLLVRSDHEKLTHGKWRDDLELPDRGLLIQKLSELAYKMQIRGLKTESAQVRVPYYDALDLVAHEQAENVLDAGFSLNVLDKDLKEYEIMFFHQLLQEFFAARLLAREPKPELVHVEWAVDKVDPPLEKILAELAIGDPLPPLPQTGWEETTLSAAPMAKDSDEFIRSLIPHNLPLAGRCAALAEVNVSEGLKARIRQELISRTQNMQTDRRARIAAGEALGIIGDPRFERKIGMYGEYLLPSLIDIPGGIYTIGDDQSEYDNEQLVHQVELSQFKIGQFPVTNAEYKCFINAKGYEDEQWWDTEESKIWLREGGVEGMKECYREYRKSLQDWTEDGCREFFAQNLATKEDLDSWLQFLRWKDEEFEQWLTEIYPSGTLFRQPSHWDDSRLNNPSQPVVGVTWFEACAYCSWLTANAQLEDRVFRLPSDIEFEAAARGLEGRKFPYPGEFDSSRCNTFESHIRRTTPVGIFDNATPEGVFDLTGNAYTHTLSIFDQQKFPYPYKPDDGRENIYQTGVGRSARGGSFHDDVMCARPAFCNSGHPAGRDNRFGFRVVCSSHPSRK